MKRCSVMRGALIISVVGARLDTKLNLHIFNRLLRLPLDYFERHPAGETMYRVGQIYRIREFLTGKLLTTFLDLITLCVLLPFLFYLNATLAWIVLALRGRDHADHPGLSEAAAGAVHAGRRRRDVEGGGARRDHRRHQDRKVAGAGAAAQSAMGRAGCRGRQVAARLRRLANWPQTLVNAARAHDGARHDDDRRLYGDERSSRLHGRLACSRS